MNSGGSHGGWSDPGDAPEIDSDAQILSVTERYERLDLLGVGGMGRVYEAYDRKLRRTVALKEVAPQLQNSPAAARLATEAMLTAHLEHPGIVSVHDSGRTEDGRLYYTMQLVRGRSLFDRLTDVRRPEQRLALVRHLLDACHAVGYAHSRGVVHRDLKPANIVVGEFGETQVVDWGLARRIDELADRGSSAGTAGYMSPEATAGEAGGYRSDVYSLGVTLREVIGEDAAPDLVAIAAQATSEDPADRYADAREMAVDLQHFIDGRRVSAYEYSSLELLKRLAIAWRAPLAVGAVAAVLLAGVGLSAWRSTTQARDRAIEAESRTRSALELSDQHLASSLESQAAAALRQGRIPAAHVLGAHALLANESPVARGVMVAASTASRPSSVVVRPLPPDCQRPTVDGAGMVCLSGGAVSVYDEHGALAWTAEVSADTAVLLPDHVAFVTVSMRFELRERASGRVVAGVEDWPGSVGLRASPDGLTVGLANGFLAYFYDVVAGKQTIVSPCPKANTATEMALSNTAAFIVCNGGRISEVSRSGVVSQFMPLEVRGFEPVKLAYTPGFLIGGSTSGVAAVFDAVSGQELRSARVLEGSIDTLVPLRGLSAVAIQGARSGVRIWDFEQMVEVLRLPAPTRAVAAHGPDHLWVVGNDLRLWELPREMRPRRFEEVAGVAGIDVSADTATVAGAYGDGTVVAWNTANGAVRLRDRWQDRVAKWVHFTPDGRSMLGHGLGASIVKRWSLSTWAEEEPIAGGPLRRMGLFDDGSFWSVAYGTGVARSGRFAPGINVSDGRVFDAAAPRSGSQLFALDEKGRIIRLAADTAEGTVVAERPGTQGVDTAESGHVALLFRDSVEVLTPDFASSLVLEAGREGLTDVAISPNGGWVAAGTLDGGVLLWDTRSGLLVADLVGHTRRVSAVRFTADSQSLFSGDWAGVILRWDLAAATRPAAELVAEAESTWQLSLDAVLRAAR